MKIRSVTLFVDGGALPEGLAEFVSQARQAFPVPVQSVRVAAPPLPDWAKSPEEACRWVKTCHQAGIDYCNVGPVLLEHPAEWLQYLGDLIGSHTTLFGSAEVSDRAGRIDPGRAADLGRLVKRLSQEHENGFGNLYFTVLANCPPETPFFPAGYSAGRLGFALALEAADLTRRAVAGAPGLEQARRRLIQAIESGAATLSQSAAVLGEGHGVPFRGIDFSYAPYPSPEKSVAATLEDLGLPRFGQPGSLFSAAFVTDALQRARFDRCGFNGLMLPVLEDEVLARRAASGTLDLQKLLLYSSVCGVGLDTVPLPGSVSEAELRAVFLDLAALAARLNKPLTARLMPMPGLEAGAPVSFDFPFFADGRVMPLESEPLQGALAEGDFIDLQPFSR